MQVRVILIQDHFDIIKQTVIKYLSICALFVYEGQIYAKSY